MSEISLRSARRSGINPGGRRHETSPDEALKLHEVVQHGANAAHLADYAEETLLVAQEGRIRGEMFVQIDSGEPLDPMKAVQAWIELRSAYRLVKDLRRAQKAGVAAHKRLDALKPETEQDQHPTGRA